MMTSTPDSTSGVVGSDGPPHDQSTPAPKSAPEEARARHEAQLEVLLQRSEEEWEAIQDAIATVITLMQSPGHTLTQADCDALQLADRSTREDEESAIDAFIRGEDFGRRQAAGAEVADLLKRVDVLETRLATQRALTKFYSALCRPLADGPAEGHGNTPQSNGPHPK